MIDYTTPHQIGTGEHFNCPTLALPTKKECRQKNAVPDKPESNGNSLEYRLNGKKLSEEVRNSGIDIADENLVFIKSPKGTGKTTFLRQYLNSIPNSRRALAVVHRRSLAKTLSTELGLYSYLEDSKFQNRYVISIDSLVKFDMQNDHPYRILILDEVEQVFQHLFGETTEKNRAPIFQTLVWLINGAKQIICSDADLTGDLTCYLMSKLRSSFYEDKYVTIVNEWKTDRTINVYESKQHLIHDLISDLADGKRLYIPVGVLSLVENLTSLFEHMRNPDGSPISVLELTGPTSDGEKAKAFFADPDTETQKYQVIIATSTLSTGVSIDVKWFDAVYGIFDPAVYTYQDCDQAISRVRNCESVNVWIHRGPKPIYSSEEAIRSGPVKKELRTKSYTIPDSDGKLSEFEELYMDSEARTRWCQQEWRNNRLTQFIDLKEGEGWHVNKIEKNLGCHDIGVEALKLGKDPIGDKYYLSIFTAKNLTHEDASAFSDKKNVRGPDSLALKKYWIARFFELRSSEELTLAQIRGYNEKNLRNIIKNAKLLKASRSDAVDRDRYERQDGGSKKAFTSYDHRTQKRDVFENAQNVTGIDYSNVLKKARLYSDSENEFNIAKKDFSSNSREYRAASKKRKERQEKLKWPVTQDQIDKLANYVNSDLECMNLILGTNFKTPTAPETKMKVFNTVMGQIGIEIKKKPKPKKQGGHEYLIDYDRVADLVKTKDLSQIVDL